MLSHYEKQDFKRIVFALIFLICIMLLAGCVNSNKPEYFEENLEFGSYHIYKTNDSNKYLQFLDGFDDSKFEIVDISYGYGSRDKFLVTYRSR